MLTLKGIRIKCARVSMFMLCTRLVNEVNHVEAPLDIFANDITQWLGDLDASALDSDLLVAKQLVRADHTRNKKNDGTHDEYDCRETLPCVML